VLASRSPLDKRVTAPPSTQSRAAAAAAILDSFDSAP